MTRDEYDSAPLRSTMLEWTRVYRLRERIAHLRKETGDTTIACNDPADPEMPPALDDCWLGTGSQAEYEHAAALPLCPRCFARREPSYGGEGYDPSDPGDRR